jgi:ferredoxin
VTAGQGAIRVVRVLSDPVGAVEGRDYEVGGHIDVALLTSVLPFNDYDFYLCGPVTFMQSIYDGLRQLNIADDRIHAESFGPARLKRLKDAMNVAPAPEDDSQPRVTFVRSLIATDWTKDSTSLLELAEKEGLRPPFDCRYGACGTCRTRLISGEVMYRTPPTMTLAADEILICCAQPHKTVTCISISSSLPRNGLAKWCL